MSPLLPPAELRAAGRNPPLPCRIVLEDGRSLELLRALRILPGKRLVAEARLDGAAVLAKLFLADGAERHAARERDGIAALQAAAIPTPAPVADAPLNGGGRLIATRFLEDAISLAEAWDMAPRPPGDADAIALLAPALATLARMHAAGLAQADLHPGNFLLHDGALWVIDGDAVTRAPTALPTAAATANLAILLAQLPPAWDEQLPALLAPYTTAGGQVTDAPTLLAEVASVRAWRLDDLLAKSVRECSLFAVGRSATRFTSVVRDEADALAPLLADPDAAVRNGVLLKDGNSATVARVVLGTRELVVKRYNLKHLGHALSRAWRPSRAWHSWRVAHRLRFLDIATPRPLALIEERLGPLRRRAWLVTELCPGRNLLELLAPDQPPPADIARELVTSFSALHAARIQHGDLKATNLLWHEGRLNFIDLDATTAHRDAHRFERAWARDRARLLRNWPPECVLARWLDEHLP